MKHFRLPAFALASLALLAGCEKRDPVADEANVATPAPVTNNSAEVIPGPIPAAIRGRWGMTPVDCTSTRGDAKGLLVIGPDSLKFYELRAVPGTSIESGDQGISGNFNFTGEGQQWSKYVSLKLKGELLRRSERNPVASYNYARC